MRSVIRNIRVLEQDHDNYEARSELAWASAMAENGVLKIGKVTDFQAHQIEHQLGAYTGCNARQGAGGDSSCAVPAHLRRKSGTFCPLCRKCLGHSGQRHGFPAHGAAGEGGHRSAGGVHQRDRSADHLCSARGIPEDTDLRAVADSTNITAGCCKKLTHDEIYEILLECR